MIVAESGAVSIHFRIRPRVIFSATLTLYGRFGRAMWKQWSYRYEGREKP